MKIIWPLILISYASLFVFGISDNIRGPLFPEILKEFNINDSKGSLMFALSSLSGFVASHFARILLRRFDRKSILQWACIGLTLTLIGLATSPNFYVFLFFSILFGLNSGIIGLVPNVLVPLGSTVEKKQQLLSGLHAMYGVASLIAPMLVASISFMTGNWRYTFLITALAPLSLFFYSLHKSHHSHHQKPITTKEEHSINKKNNFKPQVFLAFMVSFAVAAEVMISSRLALYMRRVWNFDLKMSSIYVTYFFIFLLVGRLLFTGIKLKCSIRYQLSGCLLVTACLVACGLFFHPLFLAAAGFSIAPFYPLAIEFISSEFPVDLDTAVSYMMATDSLMLAIMHLSVGKLSDSFGIHQAFFSDIFFLSCSLFLVNSYHLFFKSNHKTR
jgi:FHS family glucose/mannose:H+ symporter-like MFS transporter